MNLTGTSPKTLAVITGAYGGAGRAVARRLGARYRLVLTGRDPRRIARAAARTWRKRGTTSPPR